MNREGGVVHVPPGLWALVVSHSVLKGVSAEEYVNGLIAEKKAEILGSLAKAAVATGREYADRAYLQKLRERLSGRLSVDDVARILKEDRAVPAQRAWNTAYYVLQTLVKEKKATKVREGGRVYYHIAR